MGFGRTLVFTITVLEPRRVLLTAKELFKGLLLPVAQGLPQSAAQGLDMMNKALPTRAELLDWRATVPVFP